MSEDRRKEIVRHLSEDDLNRLLSDSADQELTERVIFLKRLYEGATLENAAADVGRSPATATRWVRRWNEGGLGLLMPKFRGGSSPKLNQEQQEHLLELLREGQPWEKQEVQHLINVEFDVEFHPTYLPKFLKRLGLSYVNPQTKHLLRSEGAEETPDEHIGDASDPKSDQVPQNKRNENNTRGWVVDENTSIS